MRQFFVFFRNFSMYLNDYNQKFFQSSVKVMKLKLLLYQFQKKMKLIRLSGIFGKSLQFWRTNMRTATQ